MKEIKYLLIISECLFNRPERCYKRIDGPESDRRCDDTCHPICFIRSSVCKLQIGFRNVFQAHVLFPHSLFTRATCTWWPYVEVCTIKHAFQYKTCVSMLHSSNFMNGSLVQN